MKLKGKLALLLAVLMMLSPLSAFARVELPDPMKNIDDDIEIEEPKIPEVKRESEKEPEKVQSEPIKGLEESEEKPEFEKEEAVEEPEDEEDIEVQDEENPAEEETKDLPEESSKKIVENKPKVEAKPEAKKESAPKTKAALKKEVTEELEIGEDLKPENIAVKGNGGGSGGSVLGGSREVLYINKKDSDGKPMKVAFKVTNTDTNETHIVVTGEDGKSGIIVLAYRVCYDTSELPTEIRAGKRFDKETMQKIIEELQNQGIIEKGKKPDIWLDNADEIPDYKLREKEFTDPPIKEIEDANHNDDKFLDENGNLKENYDFELDDLTSGTVQFHQISKLPDTIKGNIRLLITYSSMDGIIGPGTPINPNDYKGFSESYLYEDRTVSDMRRIDKNKIIEFAKNRLARLIKEDKKLELKDNNMVSFRLEFVDNLNLYKFEEIRTKTNKNKSLINFYAKSSPDLELYPDYESPNKGDFRMVSNKEAQVVDGVVTERLQPGHDVFTIPTYGVVNELFEFKTKATDGTEKEEQTVEKSKETTVIDKIKYDGLSPGKDYKFVGKIYKKTADGIEKDPIATSVLELDKLKKSKGDADVEFIFDSSEYKAGDEFVIVYDIYENGKLAGDEMDYNNADQTFTIKDKETPPPEEETPPPEEETPPPEEETPPPEKEVPPPEEETPPPDDEVPPPEKEVPPPEVEIPPEKEIPEVEEIVQIEKVEVEVKEPTPEYVAPKTYDAGMGISIIAALMSGAGLLFLKKKR